MSVREFLLPDMGSGSKEATVANWLVAVGDKVTTDDLLCEIETEKSAIEVPAPFTGTVIALACAAGETVMVGEVLATLDDHKSNGADAAISPANGAHAAAETPHAPIVNGDAAPSKPLANPIAIDRARAMPSARRLAREHDLDINQLTGTGKAGRITKGDILAVLDASQTPASAAAASTDGLPAAPEIIKFNAMRKTISEHMARSWREIPHVFTEVEVHGAPLLALKDSLAEAFGVKIPLELFLIRAAIDGLRAFPNFNATLDGDVLTRHRHYHIGAAAATPDGLIVPVVKNANKQSPRALVETLRGLAERAMSRKITPTEQSGLTFTVNNIGALGHVQGTSIIPYGTTGILSACRMSERPANINGELCLAPMMTLTLSFDHRVIDGAEASAFMQHIAKSLEAPLGLMVD